MSLGPWDTAVVGTWDAQTEKWDVINFSLSGTLQSEARLSSLVSVNLSYSGTLQGDIELNSPPEFPVIALSGLLQMEAVLTAKIDYAIWVEETPRSKVWTEEDPG